MSIISNLKSMIIRCLPDNIPENKINIKLLDDSGYCCDAAIVASSIFKKDILSLAKRIKNCIDNKMFNDIIIGDDGMLTFYLNKEYLLDCIKDIICDGKDYGMSNYGKKKKICLECVIEKLDNETKQRIIYLDCLANIMSFSGFDVITIGYVKDNLDVKSKLEDMRVFFDCFVSRDNLDDKGIVDNALSFLQRSNNCFIKKDELWFKLDEYGDVCLTNSDGDYMDFLYLISYYMSLFNKKYDGIIDICSSDDDINIIKNILIINNYDLDKLNIKKFNSFYDIDSNTINDIRYKVISGSDKIDVIEKAYSRLCYLLKEKRNSTFESNSIKKDEYAYTIMNKLLEFEDIITWCATRGVINRLCNYLEDLVYLFNNYNSTQHIYNDEDNLIIKAVYIVINNIACMLGLILREDL